MEILQLLASALTGKRPSANFVRAGWPLAKSLCLDLEVSQKFIYLLDKQVFLSQKSESGLALQAITNLK